MTSWLKVRSWHVEVPGDKTRTLCGLTVGAHPDRSRREHQVQGWSETLPAGRSCESCLRIQARRDDQ